MYKRILFMATFGLGHQSAFSMGEAAFYSYQPHYFYNYQFSRQFEWPAVERRSQGGAVIPFKNLNITDDGIVESLRDSDIPTVSSALKKIGEHLKSRDSFIIDLSENTICNQGAQLIGEYFSDKSNIVSLDLSWNRICDSDMAQLIISLKDLLQQGTFESLIITGNYGANIANLRSIARKLEMDQASKSKILKKILI